VFLRGRDDLGDQVWYRKARIDLASPLSSA
jgi:hypothetical protein